MSPGTGSGDCQSLGHSITTSIVCCQSSHSAQPGSRAGAQMSFLAGRDAKDCAVTSASPDQHGVVLQEIFIDVFIGSFEEIVNQCCVHVNEFLPT